VNIEFKDSHGFILISEPAPDYYVNVGTHCRKVTDGDCRWFHASWGLVYFASGGSESLLQVTSLGAGTFQITAGHFTSNCCESVDSRDTGRWAAEWGVSGRSLACFIHFSRTGTLGLLPTGALSKKKEIRAYDYHSLKRVLTDGADQIGPGEGVGAVMLNNRADAATTFQFQLSLTDPNGVNTYPGRVLASVARAFADPVCLYSAAGIPVVSPLHRGGCVGLTCPDGDTTTGGNIGGTPTKSDGDPIYEEGMSTILIVVIVLAVVVALLIIGIVIWCCCRKRRVGAEQMPPPEERDGEMTPYTPANTFPQYGYGQAPRTDPYAVASPYAYPLEAGSYAYPPFEDSQPTPGWNPQYEEMPLGQIEPPQFEEMPPGLVGPPPQAHEPPRYGSGSSSS
jgi:hypothetical protein